MKVLLIKDVYKLGRAGDVKRVADGYGRNYLLPHSMAVLATASALKQAENIRKQAAVTRAAINKEMGVLAEHIDGIVLYFPARASETGKLYGSITNQMVADAIGAKAGFEVARRTIDSQPIRTLGEHIVHVRLTVDLIPTVKVIVHREGEAVGGAPAPAPTAPAAAAPAPAAEETAAPVEEAAAEPAPAAEETAAPVEEAPAEPAAEQPESEEAA